MITSETGQIPTLNKAFNKLGRGIKITIGDDDSIDFKVSSSHTAADIFPHHITQKIFAQLIVRANDFFTKDISLSLKNADNLKILKKDSHETNLISSWLTVSGAFKGLFIFSYENKLAEFVLNKFITDQIEEDEYNELLLDMISEITNMISGGASDLIHDSMGNSILEVPVTIVDKKFKCLCNTAEFLTYHGITNRGYFEITTLISKP